MRLVRGGSVLLRLGSPSSRDHGMCGRPMAHGSGRGRIGVRGFWEGVAVVGLVVWQGRWAAATSRGSVKAALILLVGLRWLRFFGCSPNDGVVIVRELMASIFPVYRW